MSTFQSTYNLICFDTALPSQQCSPLLWFQRTRDTQNLYCMDGHLLKLKCFGLQYTVLHILFYCTFYSSLFFYFLPIFMYIILC